MTDNQEFRALFSLPPIPISASTALATVQTPAPKNETGDRELDAVLWLRDCINTGDSALIQQALETSKKVKTPAKELERRYGEYLLRKSGGCTFSAAFGSINFADLESFAKRVLERKATKDEAMARFGTVEGLFKDTPAETACQAALKGLKQKKDSLWGYDHDKADPLFRKVPELVPSTLSDCLHALDYDRNLYRLRNASVDMAGDHYPEFQEHADFCFRQLALIAPRSKVEALAVFNHLEEHDAMDRKEGPAILRNLVSSGWQASAHTTAPKRIKKGTPP